MAIRADFEVRNLYAAVSYRSIHTAASVRDSITVVADRRLHVVSDFRELISEPSYRALTNVFNWRQLFLADLELHAIPEIIIRTDYLTFDDDTIALHPNLGPSDTVIFSESQAFNVSLVTDPNSNRTPILDASVISVSRADTDSFTFAESHTVLSSLGKSDSLTFDDGVIAFHPNLGPSDTISLGESKAISTSRVSSDSVSLSESKVVSVAPVKTDSLTVTDSQVRNVGQVSSDTTPIIESRVAVRNPGSWTWNFDDTITGIADPDSFTLGDVFSRVVPYVRSFTDAFSLDDFAQVDKDVNGVKTNVYSLSDVLFYGLSKGVSDSYSFSDALSHGLSKVASDSYSFSDDLFYGLAKVASDSYSFSDSLSYGLSRVDSDSYSLADDLFYRLSKVASDSILLGESAAVSVSRLASDTFSFSDTTNLSPGIAKTDSTALTDDISLDPFITGAMLNQSSVGAMFLNAD